MTTALLCTTTFRQPGGLWVLRGGVPSRRRRGPVALRPWVFPGVPLSRPEHCVSTTELHENRFRDGQESNLSAKIRTIRHRRHSHGPVPAVITRTQTRRERQQSVGGSPALPRKRGLRAGFQDPTLDERALNHGPIGRPEKARCQLGWSLRELAHPGGGAAGVGCELERVTGAGQVPGYRSPGIRIVQENAMQHLV